MFRYETHKPGKLVAYEEMSNGNENASHTTCAASYARWKIFRISEDFSQRQTALAVIGIAIRPKYG